jgi:PAS domain S-box-containing protein
MRLERIFLISDIRMTLPARLRSQIQQVFDTKEEVKDELRYSRTGIGGYHEYIFQPVFDSDGNVESVVASTRDVSDRKRIEEALRDAKARLETTLYAGEIATWTWDIGENRVLADENPARLFSVTQEDAAGGPSHQYLAAIHPDDRSRVETTVSEAIRGPGRLYELDYRVIQADGSVRWVTARGKVERDAEGKAVQFPGVLIDITQRKHAEERARELRLEAVAATAKFRALFEQSRVLACILTLDGTVIDANRICLDECGYQTRDVLGRPFWETVWWRVNKTVQSKIRNAITHAAQGKAYTEELPFHWADCTERIGDFALHPIHDEDGNVIFLYPTGVDITDRKRAQESLRRLTETLELQVHTRTQELQLRNSEILQQSEQLRDLTYRLQQTQDNERRHIARELHDSAGQLITALSMNLAVIARTAQDSPVNEKVKEGQALVQQLSKEIRTMSYLLHPPLLDEAGLSGAISWYLEGLNQRSGLKIDLRISQDFGRLPDEMEMAVFRIIQECLTNIHRHSGADSVEVELMRTPKNVYLEIQDNGRGIATEKLAALQRAGVGITGMRERARRLGGTIDIDSSNRGTRVTVTFPIRLVEVA